MPFGTIPWLKFKPRTCSTEPDSLSSIDSPHQSFRNIFLIGSVCVIGVIITKPLISWYVDGSQNYEVFINCWSNVNRLLRGIGILDGVDITGIRYDVDIGKQDEVCWGNLPLEVWGEIGKRMVSRLDIVTFRSVCKKWRSSLPSPFGIFPIALPPPPGCAPEFRNKPYVIHELNIYRSKYGLPYMQVDNSGIFSLSDYLCDKGNLWDFQNDSDRAPVCLLRSFSSFMKDEAKNHNESHMDPPSFTFSEMISFFAKAYYPLMALNSPEIRRQIESIEFPRKLVVISSSDADGVNPNYAGLSNLSVVAHLGGYYKEMDGRLALLRLGGSRENWIWETDFCREDFHNIATYRGQLCILDHCARVFVMDYNSLQFTLLCAPPKIPCELVYKSLFESNGDLYLVDFRLKSRFDLEIYKLSLQLQNWVKVDFSGPSSFKLVAPFLL